MSQLASHVCKQVNNFLDTPSAAETRANLQQITAANENHASCNESMKERLPARTAHNTAAEEQHKHHRIPSGKVVFHLLCYRVLGFRVFSGPFVNFYLEVDIKQDPTLALIAPKEIPVLRREGREKFSTENL